MNTTSTVLIAVAAIAMLIDWWAVSSEQIKVERVAKPLVMIALIAAATMIDTEPSSLRPWLIIALVAGLIGDVMLLPEVDNFLFGLGAFLIGHLAYVVAFALAWDPGWLVALGIVGLILLLGSLGIPVLRAAHRTTMFWPIVTYVAVSAVVVLVAAETGRWMILVGASIFAVSDSILGHDRFVATESRHRTLIHITYHLGQAAILLGAAA